MNIVKFLKGVGIFIVLKLHEILLPLLHVVAFIGSFAIVNMYIIWFQSMGLFKLTFWSILLFVLKWLGIGFLVFVIGTLLYYWAKNNIEKTKRILDGSKTLRETMDDFEYDFNRDFE